MKRYIGETAVNQNIRKNDRLVFVSKSISNIEKNSNNINLSPKIIPQVELSSRKSVLNAIILTQHPVMLCWMAVSFILICSMYICSSVIL